MERLAQLPRRLQPATSVEDYLLAPVDRYSISRSWLVFDCAELFGGVFWGTLDAAAIHDLVPYLDITAWPHQRRKPFYLDMRLAEGFSPDVFALRGDLLASMRATVEMLVRGAIVYTPGIVGAIVTGLHNIAPPPFPEEFFTDPIAALRWAGCEQPIPLLDEIDRLRREGVAPTALVRELRALLEAVPATDESTDVKRRLGLNEAARALGHSPRSLQRKLAQAGTSFQEELALGTVRRVQRLLLQPGTSVTTVALEVGCASSQHLCRLFRKVVGQTPTEWRDRQLRPSS
jgi:AraC-like DNA-binding protein